MNIKQVYIVRKINAAQSAAVNQIVSNVEIECRHCNWAVIKDALEVDSTTLVIAVGGDGTMLEAMRIAMDTEALVMGINLGRVGFLTDISASDDRNYRYAMKNIAEGSDQLFRVEERIMLEAWVFGAVAPVYAGNEISISRKQSDSAVTYELQFDNINAGTHRANSILVSTPTGSTAYSLSAGGALMMPDLKALQIVPVAPMTMTSRPLVVSHKTQIRIKAWGGDIAVRADGVVRQVFDNDYTKESPLQVDYFLHTVNLLHDVRWNFFDMLAGKLGWIKE